MLTITIVFAVLALIFCVVEYLNGSRKSSGDFLKFDLSFNGEKIQGLGLFIDTRSEEQKAKNIRNGSLDGDVIIYFHGHGQQPKYGIEMTTSLAKKSRSGIVFIPHVYTPYGCKRRWRGDKGKLVLLMALSRYCLGKKGLSIPKCDELCDLPIVVKEKGRNVKDSLSTTPIDCELTLVGWSHGGLLARRFANAHPSCVNNLAQMTPAGYESWGRRPWAGVNLITNFMIEVGLISLMVFKGHIKYPLIAGVAIVRGTLADSLYAVVSYVKSSSNLPLKLVRAYIDIEQCSHVATDLNLPVAGLDNIVVLFGQSDTVFEARNALTGVDIESNGEISKLLFEKYYPSAVEGGANCSFKILPGNHIGPLVHAEQYVEEVLQGTGQRA